MEKTDKNVDHSTKKSKACGRRLKRIVPEDEATFWRYFCDVALHCLESGDSLVDMLWPRKKTRAHVEFRRRLIAELRRMVYYWPASNPARGYCIGFGERLPDAANRPLGVMRLSTNDLGWLLGLDHSTIVCMDKR